MSHKDNSLACTCQRCLIEIAQQSATLPLANEQATQGLKEQVEKKFAQDAYARGLAQGPVREARLDGSWEVTGEQWVKEKWNPDPINPDYYTSGGYEARKVAKAFGFEAYLFNAFKYMCRAGRKSKEPVVDLKKAIRMLEFRIEELQGK